MRRSGSAAQATVSLFPFLAVLLCTMGALIVLLVVVNRNSQNIAAQERQITQQQVATSTALPTTKLPPESDQTAKIDALRAESEQLQQQLAQLTESRDELLWRREHLQTAAQKSQADLQDERLRLSSAEEQVRALSQQLDQLYAVIKELEKSDSSKLLTTQQLSNEVQQTQAQIQGARQRVTLEQAKAQQDKPLYAVIPYDGPNRTNRRPIYIECTRDRILLQPEGIVLTPQDFLGPSGPGNPLAATIRAMRDHLVQSAANPQSPDAEPYPLFIVRPDGIIAYYEAREAMASWANEIGYQAVDADWPLAFPAADPILKQKGNVALNEARERFQWLAQNSPNRGTTTTTPKTNYRVAAKGGGLVVDGPPGASRELSWANSLAQGGPSATGLSSGAGTGNSLAGKPELSGGGLTGNGGLSANPSGASGTNLGTSAGQNPGPGGSTLTPLAALPYGNLAGAGGSPGQGIAGQGNPGGQVGATGQAGTGNVSSALMMPDLSGMAGQNPGGTGQLGNGSPGNGLAGTANNGAANNGTAGTESANGIASTGTAGTANAGALGASTGGSSGSPGSAASGGAAGLSMMSGTPQQNGNPSANQSATNELTNNAAAPTTRQYGQMNQAPTSTQGSSSPPDGSSPNSVASVRGKNWAVASQARNSSPISRPIKIRCEAAQIVLLADTSADDPQRTVTLPGTTSSAIPDIVREVEHRIEKWGLAGKNMYWSPELVIEVDATGEQRCRDLEALLDNSGWIVKRKNSVSVEGPTLLQATRPTFTPAPITPAPSPSAVDGRALPPFLR